MTCFRVDGCRTPTWCDGECLQPWRDERGRAERLFGTGRRVAHTPAIRRKLLGDRCCRGCGQDAAEGHHVLHRSQGGDDHIDNIIPLCDWCHDLYHESFEDDSRQVAVEIGRKLRAVEVDYVLDRLGDIEGAAYLERRYYVTADMLAKLRAGVGRRRGAA